MLTLSKEDAALLQRLEEELWRDETRFDDCRMRELIADDFVEFGRSGRVYDREQTLAAEAHPIRAGIPLPGFRVRLLSGDVAQTTYDSKVTDENNGALHARRSSIWTRSGAGWKLRFHQGTPLQDES